MLDRESTFADERIVNLLKTRFVSVAIDQAYQRRQQDTEGEFYRKIVQQSPRKDFGNRTTQGLYVATATGEFLGYTNHRHPDRVMRMLDDALNTFVPSPAEQIATKKVDKRYNPKLPNGGTVVRVRSKVLGGYKPTDDRWKKVFQSAVSRDNMWVTSEELAALVQGEISASLAQRIAQYHLVDGTHGEPTMWKAGEVKNVDLKLSEGVLTGTVSLQTASNDRGYEATIYGKVETANGKLTRLDIVAQGSFHGHGEYTRGAPPREFPLAITFELADNSDIADAIPPQASRGWLDGYLNLEY